MKSTWRKAQTRRKAHLYQLGPAERLTLLLATKEWRGSRVDGPAWYEIPHTVEAQRPDAPSYAFPVWVRQIARVYGYRLSHPNGHATAILRVEEPSVEEPA